MVEPLADGVTRLLHGSREFAVRGPEGNVGSVGRHRPGSPTAGA
ncbi:hypothetical protein [Allostreptomyces psammosilenae]|uniref:Uncharacterized protein n=1 Tax=Allostreptomyces psammosilenae TaxID=1892865 RepID=A0A852ZLN4_9ACTN|nr:hypothetical protein [Allostreptomyces psammosilenae]NYI03306.1 hypothetical protein [Allostreptomyces psammosilenae]